MVTFHLNSSEFASKLTLTFMSLWNEFPPFGRTIYRSFRVMLKVLRTYH